MQTSFALEDPEVFNNVLPWSMVTQETKGGVCKDIPRNSAKLLQEKVYNKFSELNFKTMLQFVVCWLSGKWSHMLSNSEL